MEFTFEPGRFNVSHLEAPHALLKAAFGNDGDNSRDDYKSMAQWDVETPAGAFEVYDYKVGKCYDPDGLEREQITDWHVQGPAEALEHMVRMLTEAGGVQA
jgi:hypothetical protein